MIYDFHVHDAIRVEYRVQTDAPSFPRGFSRIVREERSPGGNGVICAVALASWGAQVLLTGNSIGDDSHGKFLCEQLAKVPNLSYSPDIKEGDVTPYAVLIKAGDKDVGTMLGARAGELEVPRKPKDAKVARFFWGDSLAWGDGGHATLADFSQDYPSLTMNLSGVAQIYLHLMGADWDDATKKAFLNAVAELYSAKFGGLSTIPSLEEIEAHMG